MFMGTHIALIIVTTRIFRMYSFIIRTYLSSGKETTMTNKRLTVFDNDQQFVSSLASALAKNHDVLWVKEVDGVLDTIRSCKTDIVLVSFAMGVEESFSVIREAKKWGVPSIVVTHLSTEEMAIQALNSGASYYLKKPVPLEDLATAVGLVTGNPNADLDPIDRVRFFLLENYMKDISVNDLSDAVGIRRQKIFYHFKKRYGKGIKSYLRDIRMQKAQELLETSNLAIYRIAKAVGYNHFGYFCREFKRQYNLTPKEIRRGHYQAAS
jgi:AraC-like DNA-binding protein